MDEKYRRSLAYANKRMEEYPNMEEGSGYIMWERFRTAFMDGMVECEKEMTEEMAKLNEEWRENLQYQETHPTDKTIRLILNSLGYEDESWIDFVKERIKTMEEI